MFQNSYYTLGWTLYFSSSPRCRYSCYFPSINFLHLIPTSQGLSCYIRWFSTACCRTVLKARRFIRGIFFFAQPVCRLPRSAVFILRACSLRGLPWDHYVMELWDTLLWRPLWKFKVLWQLHFVLHCKLALKPCFLKTPMCRILEMQAFDDLRCPTELASHLCLQMHSVLWEGQLMAEGQQRLLLWLSNN